MDAYFINNLKFQLYGLLFVILFYALIYFGDRYSLKDSPSAISRFFKLLPAWDKKTKKTFWIGFFILLYVYITQDIISYIMPRDPELGIHLSNLNFGIYIWAFIIWVFYIAHDREKLKKRVRELEEARSL